MKLYSSVITEYDVDVAFATARSQNGADIWIDDIRMFKPRGIYRQGVEFFAYSQNGKRASGHGPTGSYSRDDMPRAASWTDYGYVIARLFNVDPKARIGSYDGVEDFERQVRAWTPRGGSLAFLDVLEAAQG